jgi:hypothetical protein
MVDGQPLKSGKKNDKGKPPIAFCSGIALEKISEVLSFGEAKYGRDNWRAGLSWVRVTSAVLRHLFAWLRGEDKDPETGLSHLAHAGCGLMFLLEYEETRRAFDDRYKGHSQAGDIRMSPSNK